MNPEFVRSSDIDRVKWDRSVELHGRGSIENYSWYLDAVCDSWNAVIAGDYEYIFPVATKHKGPVDIAYQPFFTRNFEITGPGEPDQALIDPFLKAVPTSFKEIAIGLPYFPELSLKGFKTSHYPYQVLDLLPDSQQLFSDFTGNTKRNINKLAQSGTTYRPVTTTQVVELFARETAGKIGTMRAADLERLQRLLDSCLAHRAGVAMGAFSSSGELLANAFFVLSGDVVFYLKGASTANGRSSGAMYGLLHHVISTYSGKPGTFDFGGSRIPSISAFFKRFGATDRHYTFIEKDQSFFLTLGKKLYHQLRK